MKKEAIEELFEMINERFEFEFSNAENLDDLKERIEGAICEIKNELIENAE